MGETRQEKWNKRNKESQKLYRRNYNIKKRYGISSEEYDNMFINEPICEICFINPSEHLDHCHTTGKIRGVLCRNCNTGIGLLQDEVEVLQSATKYLKERS